jgi:demethylmacrocin O-methyltransferase
MTDDELVGRVLAAGLDSDAGVAAMVSECGLDPVLGVLVDEIRFRCARAVNMLAVDIALDVTHGCDTRRVVFRIVDGKPIEVLDPADAPAGPVRRQLGITLADLLRRIFGHSDRSAIGDFDDCFLPTRPDDLAMLPAILAATNQASGTLMSGLICPPVQLGALAVEYGSDKWASFHWYTAHYEKHFAKYRDQPVRVLEIGIGGFDADTGGGSLRMWKTYFRRGLVFGLDLFDKSELDQQRLTTLVADQSDAAGLRAIADRYGPFDIVIDDGSHENEHIRTSFDALFPHVRPGGVYVIEDLQTAYFPRFGGTAGAAAGPDTSVGLLKRLLDDIHAREVQPDTGAARTITQTDVIGVSVYRNIAFIDKGVNGERGLPAWMDDEAWRALGAIPPAAE